MKGLPAELRSCVKGPPPALRSCVKGLPPALRSCVKGLPPELRSCVKGLPAEFRSCVKGLPPELRGCVKVEVAFLGSPSQTARNSGLRGRKATLRELFQLCGTVTESRQPAAGET